MSVPNPLPLDFTNAKANILSFFNDVPRSGYGVPILYGFISAAITSNYSYPQVWCENNNCKDIASALENYHPCTGGSNCYLFGDFLNSLKCFAVSVFLLSLNLGPDYKNAQSQYYTILLSYANSNPSYFTPDILTLLKPANNTFSCGDFPFVCSPGTNQSNLSCIENIESKWLMLVEFYEWLQT